MRVRNGVTPAATVLAIAIFFSMLVPAQALPLFTFTTPDAPVPASPGTGLSAEVWTGVNVDTLAAAQTHVGATAPTATFTSTAVDYPQGAANVISTGVNFGTLLGSDAASLSVDITGTQILNSIMRFSGFILVSSAGSEFFELGSDDGSRLVIQGTEVINNDGIHAFPGAGSGPVEIGFTQPGLYAMEILFFESQVVDYGIEFTDGGFGTGDIIPMARLFPADHVSEPATLTLFAFGLAGLGFVARRRRKNLET